MTYALLDSGDEKKLEMFGAYTLIRPAPQAVWPCKAPALWSSAAGQFQRRDDTKWCGDVLPPSWEVPFHALTLKLALTDFGHVGLFPEHAYHWNWMESVLKRPAHILHLFAYTGATTLALARHGHRVCHVDASQKTVAWARENAQLSTLQQAPIRWIVDDALRFVRREKKRGVRYDAIVLDPPSFGRGNRGQVFKIEKDLFLLLTLCANVLAEKAAFVLLTAHTPGFTPIVLEELLARTLPTGQIAAGEMRLEAKAKGRLPSGAFARWQQ